MTVIDAEIKAINKDLKKARAQEKECSVHYEMGESAAWRGESIDDMPRFKRSIRASSWLKGHADGLLAYDSHRNAKAIDKAGLKRMCDVMKSVLETHSSPNNPTARSGS